MALDADDATQNQPRGLLAKLCSALIYQVAPPAAFIILFKFMPRLPVSQEVWLPLTAALSIVAFRLCWAAAHGRWKMPSEKNQRGAFFVFLFLWCLSFILGSALINEKLDRSAPETFTVDVVQKRSSGGAGSKGPMLQSYYAVVTPWRPGDGSKEIRVDRGVYDSLEPGVTKLDVAVRKGALGFEWVAFVKPSP